MLHGRRFLSLWFLLTALAIILTRTVSAAPTWAGCSIGGPGVVEINREMSRTVEQGVQGKHFNSATEPITVPDGRGTGMITAVVGSRFPSTDGSGQILFLWHGTRFMGWGSLYEARKIRMVRAFPGGFEVSYDGQPAITYAWSSNRIFISNGTSPDHRVRVRLLF